MIAPHVTEKMAPDPALSPPAAVHVRAASLLTAVQDPAVVTELTVVMFTPPSWRTLLTCLGLADSCFIFLLEIREGSGIGCRGVCAIAALRADRAINFADMGGMERNQTIERRRRLIGVYRPAIG